MGKTHLLRALEQQAADVVVNAAGDTPAAALSGWWEAQWQMAEQIARTKGRALLRLDEVQYVPDWARRLKGEHDRMVRARTPVQVVATGASGLRLGHGGRETMAGRFEVLRRLHWPAQELVGQLKIPAEKAAEVAVRYGTFPGAVSLLGDPPRWQAYLREGIIEPAIGRDIGALEAVRKPAHLRQVLALAAGHAAEIVSLQKMRGQLTDPGALETVAHYLRVLEQAYLVTALEKLSARAVRRRAAPPELVVPNQGLVAAMTDPAAGAAADDRRRRGRWVENACLALAWNAGQTVRYWREEPFEVDALISGSWGRWAIEVTTGPVTTRDLGGLLRFISRQREWRPLLICDPGQEDAARKAGVAACSWMQFLLEGPPP